VPPQEIRELRGLEAQRQKMTRLAKQAKNRLHAVIQRHHLLPLAGNPFGKTNNGWWESLALGRLEKMNLQSDLETLQFAGKQEAGLEEEMTGIVAENEEIGRLLHICGFGVITAVKRYMPQSAISLALKMQNIWLGMRDWERGCMTAD
jgi:transposase